MDFQVITLAPQEGDPRAVALAALEFLEREFSVDFTAYPEAFYKCLVYTGEASGIVTVVLTSGRRDKAPASWCFPRRRLALALPAESAA